MIKINESEEVTRKEIDSDWMKVRKFADGISIEEYGTYGGPHRGFGISAFLPNGKGGLCNEQEVKDFIKNLQDALKEVDNLNKKYKGKKII